MPTQTDVQQLIQSLAPGAVNNGNPNTIYNVKTGGNTPPVQMPGGAGLNVASIPGLQLPSFNLQLPPVIPPAGAFGNWVPPGGATTPNLPQWVLPQAPVLPPTQVPPGPTPTGPSTGGPLPPQVTPQVPPRSGGGFGGPGCVTPDSFIYGFGRAGDVKEGDYLTVIDPINFELSEAYVSYSEAKMQPTVRLVTKQGTVLDCSRSAPICNDTGNQVDAEKTLGLSVPIMKDGTIVFETIIKVEDLGDQIVQHITCEDNFFLAGKEEGNYYLHHNIKFNEIGLREAEKAQGGNPDWLSSFGGRGDYSSQWGAIGATGGLSGFTPPPSTKGTNVPGITLPDGTFIPLNQPQGGPRPPSTPPTEPGQVARDSSGGFWHSVWNSVSGTLEWAAEGALNNAGRIIGGAVLGPLGSVGGRVLDNYLPDVNIDLNHDGK